MVELGIFVCLTTSTASQTHWMFLKHWQCQIYCSLWISFTFHWHHKQRKSTPGLLVRRESVENIRNVQGKMMVRNRPPPCRGKTWPKASRNQRTDQCSRGKSPPTTWQWEGQAGGAYHIHMQTHRKINPWCGPESTVWIEKNTSWLSLL